MEIRKLKKRILKEELKRRRNSRKGRFLLFGSLTLLLLLCAGGVRYVTHLGKILEEDYARAEERVEKGDYEGAVDLYRGIYERHPHFPLSSKALFQAGELLELYLKRPQEALLTYLMVERDYPDSEAALKAQRHSAAIYMRLRDYERAIIAYQKVLDTEPADADRLHYEVADAYFKLENFEQARIEFEALARSHPESTILPEVAYRIAATWSLEGKTAEAEKAFHEVTARWPRSSYGAEARFSLASILEEREELNKSLKTLEGLRDIYPNREALERKIEQVKERIRNKRRAA